MYYNFDEIISRENTDCVKFDFRKRVFGNGSVIPLWVADTDFRTPDFIMDALHKRLEHEIFGYGVIPSSFYESIVRWNKRHHNWIIRPEWISFAPGVVPALSLLIMAFTRPDDGVLIQPPVYFPFFSIVKNHKRRLIENPLRYSDGNYLMDFSDLDKKLPGTSMMFLCSPHNPTGNVWPPDVLEKVGELCLKHNVLLISDEIHSDLILPGYRHTPTALISEKIAKNTITCMAPSKTFNLAGMSTAFLVTSNAKLRSRYEDTLDQVHVGAGNILGFTATEAAYTYGDEWLMQLMNYIAGNLKFVKDFITAKIPRIKVIEPQATYLVWLDCSELKMQPDDLKQFMIEKAGLGLNDGRMFGAEGKGFHRINIGCPRQVLQTALQKLQIAVDKYFEK